MVLNCGSSSLKFAIIDANTGNDIIPGLAERLGDDAPSIKYKFKGEKTTIKLAANQAHAHAIDTLVDLIKDHNL
ncbi:acetate kinase, partial [Psychrobacter sp. SIMBA_152]